MRKDQFLSVTQRRAIQSAKDSRQPATAAQLAICSQPVAASPLTTTGEAVPQANLVDPSVSMSAQQSSNSQQFEENNSQWFIRAAPATALATNVPGFINEVEVPDLTRPANPSEPAPSAQLSSGLLGSFLDPRQSPTKQQTVHLSADSTPGPYGDLLNTSKSHQEKQAEQVSTIRTTRTFGGFLSSTPSPPPETDTIQHGASLVPLQSQQTNAPPANSPITPSAQGKIKAQRQIEELKRKYAEGILSPSSSPQKKKQKTAGPTRQPVVEPRENTQTSTGKVILTGVAGQPKMGHFKTVLPSRPATNSAPEPARAHETKSIPTSEPNPAARPEPKPLPKAVSSAFTYQYSLELAAAKYQTLASKVPVIKPVLPSATLLPDRSALPSPRRVNRPIGQASPSGTFQTAGSALAKALAAPREDEHTAWISHQSIAPSARPANPHPRTENHHARQHTSEHDDSRKHTSGHDQARKHTSEPNNPPSAKQRSLTLPQQPTPSPGSLAPPQRPTEPKQSSLTLPQKPARPDQPARPPRRRQSNSQRKNQTRRIDNVPVIEVPTDSEAENDKIAPIEQPVSSARGVPAEFALGSKTDVYMYVVYKTRRCHSAAVESPDELPVALQKIRCGGHFSKELANSEARTRYEKPTKDVRGKCYDTDSDGFFNGQVSFTDGRAIQFWATREMQDLRTINQIRRKANEGRVIVDPARAAIYRSRYDVFVLVTRAKDAGSQTASLPNTTLFRSLEPEREAQLEEQRIEKKFREKDQAAQAGLLSESDNDSSSNDDSVDDLQKAKLPVCQTLSVKEMSGIRLEQLHQKVEQQKQQRQKEQERLNLHEKQKEQARQEEQERAATEPNVDYSRLWYLPVNVEHPLELVTWDHLATRSFTDLERANRAVYEMFEEYAKPAGNSSDILEEWQRVLADSRAKAAAVQNWREEPMNLCWNVPTGGHRWGFLQIQIFVTKTELEGPRDLGDMVVETDRRTMSPASEQGEVRAALAAAPGNEGAIRPDVVMDDSTDASEEL